MNVIKNLHYYYLFTSAFYIILYVFITPPFYTNDEFSHFQKAANKEKIYLNGELTISKNAKQFSELFYYIQLKTYIDSNYVDDYEKLEIRNNIEKEKSKNYLDKFINSKKKNFNYSKKFYYDVFPEYNWDNQYIKASLINLIGYPITGYIFSKLGVEIGKFFSEKIYISFYLGRLFNAFFCILVIFFSIKYIKRGKEFLFVLFSLPTVLKLSACFSQDGIIFAYCLLAVLIFNFLEDNKLSNSSFKYLFCLMVLFLFLISLARPTYIIFFSITLIFLFVKFLENRRLVIVSVITIFSILFLLFIKHYPMPIEAMKFDDGSTNADFLINNIKLIPKILINDLINNFFKYASMLIGFMGHGNFYLNPILLITIALIFSTIFVFNIQIKNFFSLKNFLIISTSIGSIIMMQILQYIYSTEPGRVDLIQGIDSRYFIPTAIILSLITKPNKYFLNKYLNYTKIILILIFPHFNIFVLIHLVNFFYFPIN